MGFGPQPNGERLRMKVVILCGGKGTRLAEETVARPKPMVEIGGKPMLWHIMKYYAAFGFNDFVLALGYKAGYIKDFFYHYRLTSADFTITLDPNVDPVIHGSAERDPWKITCVDTGEETLKGGRIKRVEEHLDGEPFMLTYGDGVADIDLRALLESHRATGGIGTVTGVRPPSRFGEMVLDGDKVVSFEEKPQLAQGVINGGFFVFEPAFLDYLTTDEDCDLEFGALQKLAGDGQLHLYRHDGFWQCMDNVRERDYLESLYESGEAPWKVWK
jgi:glucose-1-phosphate cytidylyltransferase